jgi:hypothetical protein
LLIDKTALVIKGSRVFLGILPYFEEKETKKVILSFKEGTVLIQEGRYSVSL